VVILQAASARQKSLQVTTLYASGAQAQYMLFLRIWHVLHAVCTGDSVCTHTHTYIHTHAHAHTCTHPHTHTPTQVTKNRFDGDLGKLPLDWDKDSLTLSGHFKPHHRGESPPSEHDNYDNRTRLTRGNRWPANRSKSEGVCNIVYVGV